MMSFNEGIAPSLTSSISLSPSDANNNPAIAVKPKAKKVPVSVPVKPDTKEKLIEALEKEYPENWALLPIGNNKNACGKYSKGWASAEPISRNALINEVKNNGQVVGIGLRSGTVSGNLLNLDEDGSTAHQLVLEMTEGVGLPRSVSFTSGKPGRIQTVFWIPDDVAAILTEQGFTLFQVTTKENPGTEKDEQLEFRFNKCYSCLPPSHHPETGRYQWVNSPENTEIAVAPEWVIAAIMDHLAEKEGVNACKEPVRVSPLDIVKAHFIIDKLPAEAADLPYATWLKILQAAHSVDCSNKMLQKCVEFSQRSENKFKEGEVESKWEGFTQEGNATGAVKIGTLVKIGREYGVDYRASLREEASRDVTAADVGDSDDEESYLPEWSNTPENYHCQAGVWKMTDHWAEIKPEAPRQGRPDFKPHDLKKSMFGFAEEEDEKGQIKKISVWRTHEFEPQLDVALYVERSLGGGMGGGGLVFRVERKQGSRTIIQRATLLSKDMIKSADFVAALQCAIGNRVSCTIRPDQLVKYFRNLHQDYYNAGGKEYKLADRIGKQTDGTWVFKDIQFKPDGSITTEEESLWVFNENLVASSYGAGDEGVDTVPLPAIAPFNPDVDGSLRQVLSRYWTTVQSYFGSLSNNAALTIGAVVAGLYYDKILSIEKFYPIYYNFGEKATGKTTSANVALALIGLNETGAMVSPTFSALYERIKRTGCLPVLWDDPRTEDKKQVDRSVQGLYNGTVRPVRGNPQKPNSPVILTTNYALGETNGAIQTRVVACNFLKVNDIDSTKWDELTDVCTKVSAAFPLLLGLGYARDKVRAVSARLRERMPGVSDRIPMNLAIFVHYAAEFLKLAGGDDAGFITWVMDKYAPAEAVRQEDKSNLEDFLEKVGVLLSENKVGGWNVTPYKSKDGEEYLAVWLPSVFEVVKKEYRDTLYSRTMLPGLIDKAGGIGDLKSVRFHLDQQSSLDSLRVPAGKPKTINHKAVLIPLNLAQKCGYSDEPSDSESVLSVDQKPITKNKSVVETDLEKVRRDLLDDDLTLRVLVVEQPLPVPTLKSQDEDVQVSLAYSIGQQVLVKGLPGVWEIVKVPSKADIRKGTVHRYIVHPIGDPQRRITVPVTQITPASNAEPLTPMLRNPDNDADMPF